MTISRNENDLALAGSSPFGEGGVHTLYHVRVAGSTVRVWAAGGPVSGRAGGGRRGVVTGFSDASRRRMLDLAHRINWRAGRVRFLTLTYEHDVSPRQAKRDLDTFVKRLRRRWGKVWALWRLERTKAGRIHFHLLVGGTGFMRKSDLQRAWASVTGQVLGITHIRAVTGAGAAVGYVVKYAAKASSVALADDAYGVTVLADASHMMGAPSPADVAKDQPRLDLSAYLTVTSSGPVWASSPYTGRHWGVVGRDNVPWLPVDQFVLAGTGALGRLLYAVGKARNKHYTWGAGVRAFGGHGRDLRRGLARLRDKQGVLPARLLWLHRMLMRDARAHGVLVFKDQARWRRSDGSFAFIEFVTGRYQYGLGWCGRSALVEEAARGFVEVGAVVRVGY